MDGEKAAAIMWCGYLIDRYRYAKRLKSRCLRGSSVLLFHFVFGHVSDDCQSVSWRLDVWADFLHVLCDIGRILFNEVLESRCKSLAVCSPVVYAFSGHPLTLLNFRSWIAQLEIVSDCQNRIWGTRLLGVIIRGPLTLEVDYYQLRGISAARIRKPLFLDRVNRRSH